MKKIGFVDYYLSEWHANNYPAWIKAACEKAGLDYSLSCAYGEIEKSPVDGVTGSEWCEKFGAEKCNSIEEVCEKSDYVMVLCPSNPEKHLEYAGKVMPFGKNTYIDKTFAPDYCTAQKIFGIAAKNDTKFFSSSALRYATELEPYCNKTDSLFTIGGGAKFEEYIVHQAEMAVKLHPAQPTVFRTTQSGLQTLCEVKFDDGYEAKMLHSPQAPFVVNPCTTDGKTPYVPITSDTFSHLLYDIVRFFDTGKTSFDVAQTLEVMKVREGAIKALRDEGQWIKL